MVTYEGTQSTGSGVISIVVRSLCDNFQDIDNPKMSRDSFPPDVKRPKIEVLTLSLEPANPESPSMMSDN